MRSSLRVLIVEDNVVVQRTLFEQLSQDPLITVSLCPSLALGLDLLSYQTFDVVLLDLNLPDAKDLEALVTLRKKVPEVAVVILTGAGSVDIESMAMRGGAQDFLEKPTGGKDLITALHKAAIRNEVTNQFLSAHKSLEATSCEIDTFDKMRQDLEKTDTPPGGVNIIQSPSPLSPSADPSQPLRSDENGQINGAH